MTPEPRPRLLITRLAHLALLASLGASLSWVEGFFPPLPVPGARLGLANLATLAALFTGGTGDALAVAALRSTLASLLGGKFLGIGFAMSFSAAVVSALAMSLSVAAVGALAANLSVTAAGAIGRPVILLVSMVGGLLHNLTQLGVAYTVVGVGVLPYLLPLILLGLLAGAATGSIVQPILSALSALSGHSYVAPPASRPPAPPPSPSLSTRKRVPLAVAGALLALSLMVWAGTYVAAGEQQRLLVVELNGQEVARASLRPGTPARYLQVELPGTGGYHATVEIRGDRARILPIPETFCPRGICSHTGWIQNPGQAAICLPNRLVIRVVAPSP
ncbi:MAG TPA: hypothetical protein GX513_12795 [Firmicutes bacterium]|nr:hypothetical protein [Bacillota bacterium]